MHKRPNDSDQKISLNTSILSGEAENEPLVITISSDDNDSNEDEESPANLGRQSLEITEKPKQFSTCVITEESHSQKEKNVFQNYLRAVKKYDAHYGSSDTHNESDITQEALAELENKEYNGTQKGSFKMHTDTENVAIEQQKETYITSMIQAERNSDNVNRENADKTNGQMGTNDGGILVTRDDDNKTHELQSSSILEIVCNVPSSEEKKHKTLLGKGIAVKTNKQHKELKFEQGLAVLTSEKDNTRYENTHKNDNSPKCSYLSTGKVFKSKCSNILETDLEISSTEDEKPDDRKNKYKKTETCTVATTSKVNDKSTREEHLNSSPKEKESSKHRKTSLLKIIGKKYSGATTSKVGKKGIREYYEISSSEEESMEDRKANMYRITEKYSGATTSKVNKRSVLAKNSEISLSDEKSTDDKTANKYEKTQQKSTGAKTSEVCQRSTLEEKKIPLSSEKRTADTKTSKYNNIKKKRPSTATMTSKVHKRSTLQTEGKNSSSEEESPEDRKANKYIATETCTAAMTNRLQANGFENNLKIATSKEQIKDCVNTNEIKEAETTGNVMSQKALKTDILESDLYLTPSEEEDEKDVKSKHKKTHNTHDSFQAKEYTQANQSVQNNGTAQKRKENGIICNNSLTFRDINENKTNINSQEIISSDDGHMVTEDSTSSETNITSRIVSEEGNTRLKTDLKKKKDEVHETNIKSGNTNAQATVSTKEADEETDSEEEDDLQENEDDDIPALEDEGELPKVFETTEISEESIESFYYPSQTDLANKIVERIELIYHYYHKNKKLESFKDFDFRIYTAKSNMLEKQTWARLCMKESGCLSEKLYEGSDIEARKEAMKRVYKYTPKTVDNAHDELLSAVTKNKDKLFLIVADEAHWGVTSQKQSNNKLVNTWNHHKHPNVIVLLVSATPYNLLSGNTRLPNVYYRYPAEETPEFLQGENVNRSNMRGKVFKKLHHIKWTESFTMKVKNGILVKFRVPLPAKETTVQLCNKLQNEVNEFLHWKSSEFSDKKQSYNHIYRIEGEESNVTVKTPDEGWILSVMGNKVGFINSSKMPAPDVITSFSILTRYGEGILLFKFTGLDNTEKQLYYDKNADEIRYRRPPPSSDEYDFEVPSPECSFLLDNCQPVESLCLCKESMYCSPVGCLRSVKEYLSLNYYLNSMRNGERRKKLLRADNDFKITSNALKRMAIRDCWTKDKATLNVNRKKSRRDIQFEDDEDTTDILTAEYSYYIVIINSLREYVNKEKLLTELLREYPKKRKANIQLFQEILTKEQSDKIYPIHRKVFDSYLSYINDKALREYQRCYKKFLKYSKNLSTIEELVSSIFLCIIHMDEKELTAKVLTGLMKEDKPYDRIILEKLHNSILQEAISGVIMQSETGYIVETLIPKNPQNANGKMKIIRVNQIECGNRMYKTLCIARKISSANDYAFEILRDYGNATLCKHFDGKFQADEKERMASYRIRKRLQPKKCTYINDETYESCDCIMAETERFQPKSDLHCTKCDHMHKRIEKYTDLEGLPCILILVYKGRLGDTFPLSFDAMDLRLCHREKGDSALFSKQHTKNGTKNKLYLSSIVQEFGRLCRYQSKSEERTEPYALVGEYLINIFYNSLIKGAVFFSCLALNPPPIAIDRKLKTNKRQKSQFPTKGSFEHENTTKHHNRILLHAEPQIGKTGVYLKAISILRKRLCRNQAEEEDDSDEEIEYETDYRCEEAQTNDNVGDKYDDAKHWIFPAMHFMNNGESIPKTITRGKYVRMYGEYVYGNAPEILTEAIINTNKRKNTKMSKFPKANTQYKSKEHMPLKENSYKAYSSREHSLCPKCNIQYENIVFDLCFKRPIKGERTTDVKFRLSVPKSQQYCILLSGIKQHTDVLNSIHGLKKSYQLSDDSVLKSWIFIPTYNRPDRGNFHLKHTMVKQRGNALKICQYTSILVVRSTEFKVYSKLWKGSHAILQIPDNLPGVERDVNEGGIGYARLAIQIFAESLGLQWIFVLDDNISYTEEIQSKQPIHSNTKLVKQILEKKDDSLTVMSHEVLRRENGSLEECGIPLFRLLKHLEEQVDGTTKDLETYTGPSSNYGIIGVKMKSRYSDKVKVPFKKTHVFSLVLLNINKLREKNIYYKPWQAFEDITLNIECDDKNVWVCKYNRFTVRKNYKISWFPTVFYWDDNVILEICEKKKAENSVESLIKWLRASYPVKHITEIPKTSGAMKTNIYYEKMLKKVSDMKGRYQLIAVQDQSSEYFLQNSEDAFAGSGSSELRLITQKLKEYFNEHNQLTHEHRCIVMLTRSFCLRNGLISKRSLKSWVQKITDEEFKMLVVTSHNVKHFKMEIILVVIEVADFSTAGTTKKQITPLSETGKRQRRENEDELLPSLKRRKGEEHVVEPPKDQREREQVIRDINNIISRLDTEKLMALTRYGYKLLEEMRDISQSQDMSDE